MPSPSLSLFSSTFCVPVFVSTTVTSDGRSGEQKQAGLPRNETLEIHRPSVSPTGSERENMVCCHLNLVDTAAARFLACVVNASESPSVAGYYCKLSPVFQSIYSIPDVVRGKHISLRDLLKRSLLISLVLTIYGDAVQLVLSYPCLEFKGRRAYHRQRKKNTI